MTKPTPLKKPPSSATHSYKYIIKKKGKIYTREGRPNQNPLKTTEKEKIKIKQNYEKR